MFVTLTSYFSIAMLAILLLGSPCKSKGQSKAEKVAMQMALTQKQYGLDPAVPLTARIKETAPDILEKFREAGMSPTIHPLSTADSMKVVRAFEALPPLHQQVLKDHLLGISFLDNMPNTALTATVNPEDPFQVFTITFRAEILKQDVSEWLTEKERSYFNHDRSNLSLSIEAGHLDAILYVLLHEATHVVDGSVGILSRERLKKKPAIEQAFEGFTENIWIDRTHLSPEYSHSALSKVPFRAGGKKLPIAQAQELYQSAEKSPFVSLYSTSSWNEDLAEFLSVSHFSEKLKQPFKIILYDDERIIYTYEPMKSLPDTRRSTLMNHFYKKRMKKS